MFSYLKTVQSLVDQGIYQRGVKYFLDGYVKEPTSLTLDYWREYKVHGTNEYYVRLPLIHLALNPAKFLQAPQALLESTSCSCEFYHSFGICKHVVAVCASLDQEFDINLRTAKDKFITQQQKTTLSNIFEAQVQRNIKEFQVGMEAFMASSRGDNLQWAINFINQVKSDPQTYKDYLARLQKDLLKEVEIWEKEKKITQLIKKTNLYWSGLWWDFWSKIIKQITFNNQIEVLKSIWLNTARDLNQELKIKLKDYFVKLSEQQKEKIQESLSSDQNLEPSLGLKFAFESKNIDWFKENWISLDPQDLFKLIAIWPDKAEEIESEILEKIKIWSDYLTDGENTEIIQVFTDWLKIFGRSQKYEQGLTYIKQNHPKKRSLLRKIEMR